MMKGKSYIALILTLTSLFYVNINRAQSRSAIDETFTNQKKWEIVNLDGNVSLSSAEDASYWNHHAFRFDEEVDWGVHFDRDVLVILRTSWGDAGHVATGMWWTHGFRQGKKIPIYNNEIRVCFDILLEKFDYEGPDEWLRVALACAIQRGNGSVIYTEMDIKDSPNTQRHPTGNIGLGGDIIYMGGDVVEFKLDEVPLQTWRHYSIDLTGYIDRAWRIMEGDRLESVYIVIESENNPVEVALRIDNLWIYGTSSQSSRAILVDLITGQTPYSRFVK